MDKSEVNDLVMGFLLSGARIAKEDENSPEVNAVVDAIKDIFDIHMPAIRQAAKEYMNTENLDTLILSLLPAHNQIWYEAYSPYWLLHCKPDESDPEFTYYNDLIDMYWHWKNQLWQKKDEVCCTIMLPPTKGLIALAYQEEQESLKEYMAKNCNNHAAHVENTKAAATKKGATNGE